jgi:hypothetical protein
LLATAAVLFSTITFLSGGIVGTFHRLYFTGTPMAVLALGANFSALEVVPLVLIGFEAYENLTLTRARPWVAAYKWPIYFAAQVPSRSPRPSNAGLLNPVAVAPAPDGLDAPPVRPQLGAKILDVDDHRPFADEVLDPPLEQFGAAEGASRLREQDAQEAERSPGQNHLALPDADGGSLGHHRDADTGDAARRFESRH